MSSGKEEQSEKQKKRKVWMWVFLWMIMPFTAFFKLEELLGGADEDEKYKDYQKDYDSKQ